VAHGAPATSDIDLEQLRSILVQHYKPTNYQDSLELIVQACQEAQQLYGYVPKAATELIAEHLGVTTNRIYGLLTFYADFLTEPPGKHVMLLCHGAACYVMGSQKVVDHLDLNYDVESGKTTKDGTLTVQIVNGCLGVCDLAPVAQLDHERYCGGLTVEKFEELLNSLRAGEASEEPDEAD
jgi:NADH-quinone oxidoreductase subunit E